MLKELVARRSVEDSQIPQQAFPIEGASWLVCVSMRCERLAALKQVHVGSNERIRSPKEAMCNRMMG